MSLACCKSRWAPVDVSAKTISSAVMPPSSTQILFCSSVCVKSRRSSSGRLHRVAECSHAAGNDRDLVDRIGIRQAARDEGVAAFVIGDAELFLFVDDPRLLFETGDDAFDPLFEFGHRRRSACRRGPRAGPPR